MRRREREWALTGEKGRGREGEEAKETKKEEVCFIDLGGNLWK